MLIVLLLYLGASFTTTATFDHASLLGNSCHPSKNRYDPSTQKYISDCDPTTFCAPITSNSSNDELTQQDLGMCSLKGCRIDEYPFGYTKGVKLPMLCPVGGLSNGGTPKLKVAHVILFVGQYCPDREDSCKPLVPVGGSCEVNRDGKTRLKDNKAKVKFVSDECLPGLNWRTFDSESNFNGSICLHKICYYSNVSLGQVSEIPSHLS
jgi:hypothetical protein